MRSGSHIMNILDVGNIEFHRYVGLPILQIYAIGLNEVAVLTPSGGNEAG